MFSSFFCIFQGTSFIIIFCFLSFSFNYLYKMNGKTGVRWVGLMGSWHHLKGFAEPCTSPKGSSCHVQIVGVHGHVPTLQASTVERWPKLDVCSMVPQEECLLTHQRHEGIRDVLYERQPLAGCLALKRLASKLESCPQPSPLSVRKFYRSWKPATSFSFPLCLPLYAAAHMHCPHPSCFGSVAQP